MKHYFRVRHPRLRGDASGIVGGSIPGLIGDMWSIRYEIPVFTGMLLEGISHKHPRAGGDLWEC